MLIYILIINILSFILMGWDKYAAIKGYYRISENTLLSCALLGGALAIFLGMIIFHHKIRKKRFLIGIPLCIILNIYYYFNYFK